MLEIEYGGGNNVVLTTKEGKLHIDANTESVGVKPPKKIAIELATEPRFLIRDDRVEVSLEGPGEYEVGPFAIRGQAARRYIDSEEELQQSTVYHIEALGFRVGILGNVSPELTDEQFEALGVVDILVIPVGGGGYTLDSSGAAKITRHIEPKVVIPVHYGDTGLSYKVPQEGVDVFIEELGVSVEDYDKLKIRSPLNLPQALTIYRLKRST